MPGPHIFTTTINRKECGGGDDHLTPIRIRLYYINVLYICNVFSHASRKKIGVRVHVHKNVPFLLFHMLWPQPHIILFKINRTN